MAYKQVTCITINPHVDPQEQATAPSVVGSETWDICTPSATTDDTTKNASDISQSSVPWPGRTFIIRNKNKGEVITFLDGQLILDKPGGLGTFRCRCVEDSGWMGFKDPASALHLGYHEHGMLFCRTLHHRNNEYICPRMRPEGDWVLLVRQDDHLRPLGAFVDGSAKEGKQKIKIVDWKSEGIFWEFLEV